MISVACATFLAATTVDVAAAGLPKSIPLYLDQGFWFNEFTVGSQKFNLTADTGSFAVLIANGLYKPTPASNSTNQGEFIQFNGASADGTAPASETINFVHDDVTYDGINLKGFLVGNITDGDPLPGDGVLGLSPPASRITDPNDPTFLAGQSLAQAICDQEQISPCEFGIGLKKDGTGTLAFGPLGKRVKTVALVGPLGLVTANSWMSTAEKCKIKGKLTTLPTLSNDAWWVTNKTADASPILVIDGKEIAHIEPILDSGTPNVIGPLESVRSALQSVGYKIVEHTDSHDTTTVFGTYDCARKPARFGFSFPPSTHVHYIDLGANVLNRTADGKTCTANILGTSTLDAPVWQIGQTWFQGRWVQHNLNASTVAFADLAD